VVKIMTTKGYTGTKTHGRKGRVRRKATCSGLVHGKKVTGHYLAAFSGGERERERKKKTIKERRGNAISRK
jgi:hypothetical protein